MKKYTSPPISVIMLTYNRENFVGRMISCILDQTFHDFEFIIVDNGSSDRSGIIADEYAKNDNRIKVIHCKRGNIGSGRNEGLAIARGEYIVYVDDDDICEPDFLEVLYNLANDNNADVAICGASDKSYDEEYVMSAEEAVIELLKRKKYNMAFPTKIFKKNLVKYIHFSEDNKYDDIEMMYRVLSLANRVAYSGKPKYTFRRHEGNHSAWTTNHALLTPEILEEYLQVYRKRTTWLMDRFPKSETTFKYFEWSFMISMIEKIIRLEISGCEKYLKDMKSELQLHQVEFLANELLCDFEKEWFEKYVND